MSRLIPDGAISVCRLRQQQDGTLCWPRHLNSPSEVTPCPTPHRRLPCHRWRRCLPCSRCQRCLCCLPCRPRHRTPPGSIPASAVAPPSSSTAAVWPVAPRWGITRNGPSCCRWPQVKRSTPGWSGARRGRSIRVAPTGTRRPTATGWCPIPMARGTRGCAEPAGSTAPFPIWTILNGPTTGSSGAAWSRPSAAWCLPCW